MPISSDFPKDPYAILDPGIRWYPGSQERTEEEVTQLVPPLVTKIRQAVYSWRTSGYVGASNTSKALLNYWFETPHDIINNSITQEFRYYFAQREAVESAIWLYEIESAHDPYALMKYDSTGRVARGMFAEDWCRYVFKLATGTGKTKVMSLLMAWSYFHKLYEPNSELSTNFLLIAPNIIVLDRLKDDFDGLSIFRKDPVIPNNGYYGNDWQNDFQITVHIQDEVGQISTSGNLFLTNVHRIYEGSSPPTFEDNNLTDYFLGPKPVGRTTDRVFDLTDVVKNLRDLVVFNDEAHHIHDPNLAWFKAIEELSQRLRQKGSKLSAQFDFTATPRHDNGATFVQTVCSYPLVEAIRQGIVKTPVLPDEASRAKLSERPSENIGEKYADHIKLGIIEWKKAYKEFIKSNKKSILFIMTTNTKECDEVAEYLKSEYPDLADSILVIHTKTNGEISESKSDELEILREASRSIDLPEYNPDNPEKVSPYKIIISVMMLKEGWDVQNVVAMVGLRPFSAKSKILPEQTLGRGLRRMFRGTADLTEYVSVIGTPAFLEFVEGIKAEGVELSYIPMGESSDPLGPMVIATDKSKANHDIELPELKPRYTKSLLDFNDINIDKMERLLLDVKKYSEAEQREIIFRDIDVDEVKWSTDLGQDLNPLPQAIIAYFVKSIMKQARVVGGHEILFEKLKFYILNYLFNEPIALDDLNIIRNLSDDRVRTPLLELFNKTINRLEYTPAGFSQVIDTLKFSNVRPFEISRRNYLISDKSVFEKVVCDNDDELKFASFLDRVHDVKSFLKNQVSSQFFSVEYINSKGLLGLYYPDFIVEDTSGNIWIIETKGEEDIDVLPKWKRLKLWCDDATKINDSEKQFNALFVKHNKFQQRQFQTFKNLAEFFENEEPLLQVE
jgi:type III restriction enzyme